MKLVVDNPLQVPVKRAGKSYKAFPHLFAKLTSGDSAKTNAMPDFGRILVARTPMAERDAEKNISDSGALEEQPPSEFLDLDATPFGNLFENMERKYEQDLKEAIPSEFHKPDAWFAQEVKLIDARTLFGNLRLDREGSDPARQVMSEDKVSLTNLARPSDVEMLAAALHLSGEEDTTNGEKSIGTDKQQRQVPEGLQVVAPQETSRNEKQQSFAGSPEKTVPQDLSTPAKSAATQGKTAETNFPSDMSAQRLEAPPAFAAAQSPMQQIAERVTKMLPAQSVAIRYLPDGQKTVRFALQPESLGDVSVILRMRDSGMDLVIRPSLPETAQYLDKSKDELLLSMKLSGVELGNVEIKPLDVTASQDVKQDKPTAGQGGSHTNQFQSPHGGSPFNGGGKENQWRAPDLAVARKGAMDETEQAESRSPAVGRGIVL